MMSYCIRVFCRSTNPVTRRELAAFISDGAFFEDEPRFEPPPEAPESDDATWKTFVVHYQPSKRPVMFERNVGDWLLQEEVGELLFILHRSRRTKAQQEVLACLKNATQVIGIEMDREGLTEDGWEMVDAVESYLARVCDGIVYAPDDGFFDRKLRRVYRL
jgi:hypothetical protein